MRIDMRYLTALSALLSMILVSSTASADEVGVELDLGTNYTSDARYDAIDDNDYQGRFGASLSYQTARLVPDLEMLFLFQRAIGDRRVNRFSSAYTSEWQQRRFMLGADYGPTFFNFLRPSARLGAGWAMQTLEVRTTGPTLQDRAHDFVAFGALGLGARFRVPMQDGSRLEAMVLGLQTHYGYMYQTEATFDQLEASSDAYSEDDPWARQSSSLGGVSTRGLFWDMGISMRFAF